MKTTVLTLDPCIITSKKFENDIATMINDEFILAGLPESNEIVIRDAGMRHAVGYGQYKEYVIIKIDSNEFELKKHSTHAPGFDFFNNRDEVNDVTYSNALKGLVKDVINHNIDDIVEEFRTLKYISIRISSEDLKTYREKKNIAIFDSEESNKILRVVKLIDLPKWVGEEDYNGNLWGVYYDDSKLVAEMKTGEIEIIEL